MSRDPDAKGALYREASTAAWIGLGINLALGIGKLAAGLLGNAFALISDAVNSLGDALTSVVVIFALHVAQEPADDEHPYGHTRAESIGASSVAILVIFSALGIGWEAIVRLQLVHEIPPWWTLAVAAANIVIKEVLYRYKLWVGERTGSSALIANAWDHRSDALCSVAVVIGMSVVLIGGPSVIWADEVAALFVVVAILWTAVQLFLKSVHELLDAQAEPELVADIRSKAIAVPGVRDVEKLFVRKSGLEYFADIHVQVDRDLTVDEGHRIGHLVKDELLEHYSQLRDVLVHLEPFPHVHEEMGDRASKN